MDDTPGIEILRGSAQPDGKFDEKSFRVVAQVPGALARNFISTNRMQYFDALAPVEIDAHSGATLFYRVRTRVSRKLASADSNTAEVVIFSVAQRIEKLQTELSETAITLRWAAATQSSDGHPLAEKITYAIYRGELDPGSAEAAAKDASKAVWKNPFQRIGNSDTNSFRDTTFDFGKCYFYVVRTVTAAGNEVRESADSASAIITPQDTFPPAAPQNIVAAALPGEDAGHMAIELSWSMGVELDLAGYRVYRSEEEGARGAMLTPEVLMTPAYRDNSVAIGHRYWYTITAVDRAGNESAPSVSSVVAAP